MAINTSDVHYRASNHGMLTRGDSRNKSKSSDSSNSSSSSSSDRSSDRSNNNGLPVENDTFGTNVSEFRGRGNLFRADNEMR